jgi:hypothetical protein
MGSSVSDNKQTQTKRQKQSSGKRNNTQIHVGVSNNNNNNTNNNNHDDYNTTLTHHLLQCHLLLKDGWVLVGWGASKHCRLDLNTHTHTIHGIHK